MPNLLITAAMTTNPASPRAGSSEDVMMSISFSVIEDSVVIFRQGYFYKQGPAYVREGCVYVRVGSGYVKMRKDKTTLHPDIKWEAFEGFEAATDRKRGDIENYLKVTG